MLHSLGSPFAGSRASFRAGEEALRLSDFVSW